MIKSECSSEVHFLLNQIFAIVMSIPPTFGDTFLAASCVSS